MSRTMKVLLIEGNEAEAREIQALLSAVEDEPFVVEWVQELKHALNRLAKEAMDVVLLSLDLPDSQGVETFVTLHDRIPGVPIVVLAGEDHETTGPAAIEKGAHHYVARHEIDGDSLVRALYYALARHHEHLLKMQQTHHDESEQVLGFLGAKGGVGQSNTALDVAVAEAMHGHPVLIVEMPLGDRQLAEACDET